MRRVVVTGMGIVSSIGNTTQEVVASLREAKSGIVHSEMFPLVNPDKPNRLELFQIWVNLPAKSKFAAPYFTMFWERDVPHYRPAQGVDVTLVAGALEGLTPPAPPPDVPATWMVRAFGKASCAAAGRAKAERSAMEAERRVNDMKSLRKGARFYAPRSRRGKRA